MKIIPISSAAVSKTLLKLYIITLIVLFSISVRGQTSQPFIVGIDGGVGTTQTEFKSDIALLDDLKVAAKGWKTGVYFGSKVFLVNGGLGKYQFSPSADSHIDQTMLSGKVTISPARLFGNSKFFRPYVLAGVDYSTYRITGMTMPAPVEPPAPGVPGAPMLCGCPVAGAPGLPPPPPNPDTDAETTADGTDLQPGQEPTSATLKKAQINGGLGIELSVNMNGLLVKVFGEGYYGVALKEKFSNERLAKTSLSSQLVINIGLGVGLTRKK